jgi:hypothetical protein
MYMSVDIKMIESTVDSFLEGAESICKEAKLSNEQTDVVLCVLGADLIKNADFWQDIKNFGGNAAQGLKDFGGNAAKGLKNQWGQYANQWKTDPMRAFGNTAVWGLGSGLLGLAGAHMAGSTRPWLTGFLPAMAMGGIAGPMAGNWINQRLGANAPQQSDKDTVSIEDYKNLPDNPDYKGLSDPQFNKQVAYDFSGLRDSVNDIRKNPGIL